MEASKRNAAAALSLTAPQTRINQAAGPALPDCKRSAAPQGAANHARPGAWKR